MSDVLFIIIVVIVLLIVVLILLMFATRRVNVLVRDDFINKLHQLDSIIGDKESKIEDLNQNITSLNIELNKLKEKESNVNIVSSKEEVKLEIPGFRDYVDNDFFDNYKKIRDTFNFDSDEIIKEFLSKKVKDNDSIDYLNIKDIRNYFSYDNIYKISTLTSEQQKDIINEILNEKDKKVIKKYFNYEKLDVSELVYKLDYLLTRLDPKIEIVISDKNKDFSYLNSNIEMVYNENIVEGFKIKYKGVLYDYSIE